MSSCLQSLQQVLLPASRPKVASFPQGQRGTSKLIMPSCLQMLQHSRR
eukprot:CAMPEP_0203925076 /NCGR_PEP_ID=MMETSP0359-20131031/64769_1 /ASSEMBLY_ACC=CAM_ASM_000338 /TAXON_ID=268821 /ORGANISM="Scrippsiella Hangoei, Strain SHTV-5" /LENGTH=47 /DNA_ID= /DNA_START= /DNA_END= /DNA_ORIENTATION=